ncbi:MULTISPECIES: HGxxPAAW family protein [Streptosporangium]|uniref:HGxxPAAW family protein n=1 Tax=Streptosporangium TaxID=2000 RepID=UPI0027D79148|nr:HGxxPAAW family protein [Streptosporangium brasiliense]
MAGSHGGSPKSWLAVIVILIGFTIGGVALCVGPNWTLFWAGAGVVVVGGVIAMVVDIFSDVIVDAPRVPLDRTS